MPSLMIRVLSPKAFSKYGRILVPTPEERNASQPNSVFYVLETAVSEGWRMAYLDVYERERDMLSNHPNTKETFEPLEGVTALAVAPHDNPDAVEVFLLDKPIVLNEGVWHSEPIALSEKASLRINENLKVQGEKYVLPFKIKAELYTEKK